jgi:23S rRNA (cytidine1920-2'-O)/16S rRNA (cytidine1409-2'-O)-methyltransferase
MATRRRLDAELVRRGLSSSRSEAQAAIEAGWVTVSGAPASKTSRLVAPDEPVRVVDRARFVSRGGEKLDAALSHFDVVVDGRRALDAGASTGGFTDCLLQRGARQVVAVDVGHGQLHPRVRDDERVVVLERTNIRSVTVEQLGGTFDLVVADLSFISLRTVSDALLRIAAPGADLVWLVKPQFEAGRVEVARGRGVVKDQVVRSRVQHEIDELLTESGATVREWMDCPIIGPAGNVEMLVHAIAPSEARRTVARDASGAR